MNYGTKEGDIFSGSNIVNKPSIYYNQLVYKSFGSMTSSAIAVNVGDMSSATAYLMTNLDIPVLSDVKVETRTSATGNVNNDADWSAWQEATNLMPIRVGSTPIFWPDPVAPI